MKGIEITVRDLYNYIKEHNTIGNEIEQLRHENYKRLRIALKFNDIPVVTNGMRPTNLGDWVACFRSQRMFNLFMEIWNPTEEYKAWADGECW